MGNGLIKKVVRGGGMDKLYNDMNVLFRPKHEDSFSSSFLYVLHQVSYQYRAIFGTVQKCLLITFRQSKRRYWYRNLTAYVRCYWILASHLVDIQEVQIFCSLLDLRESVFLIFASKSNVSLCRQQSNAVFSAHALRFLYHGEPSPQPS